MVDAVASRPRLETTLKAGKPVAQNGKTQKELADTHHKISDFNHSYYRHGMNAPFGPAGIIGLVEAVTGFVIWRSDRQPATLTAFLVSLAEYANVLVSGKLSHIFGKGDTGTKNREGFIAHVQGLVGLVGLGSLVSEVVKEKEEEEMSLTKKVGLTAAAVVNSALMFLGFGEKSLLASISKGMKGHECKGMQLNANSDLRTALSWLTIGFYVWLSKIKPIKLGIDLAIPLLAVRDALAHYAHDGFTVLGGKNPVKKLPKGFSSFLSTITFSKGEDKRSGVPWMFNKHWFLGKGKFRDTFIVPVAKILNCKVPQCNINGHKDEHIVSVKVEDYKAAMHMNGHAKKADRERQYDMVP